MPISAAAPNIQIGLILVKCASAAVAIVIATATQLWPAARESRNALAPISPTESGVIPA